MKCSWVDSSVKMSSSVDWLRPHLGPVNPPAHPEDGDEVSSPNVGKPSYLDVAVCLRLFHWIFIIHCFYMFRPQNIALFRELQTSYIYIYIYIYIYETFSDSRIHSLLGRVVGIVEQVWSQLRAVADTIYHFLFASWLLFSFLIYCLSFLLSLFSLLYLQCWVQPTKSITIK